MDALSLRNISPEQLSRFWRRAKLGARAAFSDGHGSYLLAMVALGGSATFLHHALRPEREYHEALAGLIAAEQEPFRGEAHPVLATALVPGTTAWDPCKDATLLRKTEEIADQLSTAIAKDDASDPRLALHPCDRDPRAPWCPQRTADLGPAWTDDSTRSTLLIPSTVAELVRNDRASAGILVRSRALEDLEPLLTARDDSLESETVRGIFFIALSGAIRIMPSWSVNSLPAHRTFAGASYFYATLSGESSQCRVGGPWTITRPYLDLAGSGVVRTLCRSIHANQAGADDSAGHVAGALCFDVVPPADELHRLLRTASEIYDLQLVHCRGPDGAEDCAADHDGPALSSFSAEEIRDLTARWNRSEGGKAREAAGESAITLLDDNRYFAAVVGPRGTVKGEGQRGAARGDAARTVVFGRVQRSPTRGLASALTMLTFATLAVGTIVHGVRKKASRLDITLIRGLQVGVVEIDARGAIVGANDRAEEIFATELPAFGTSDLRDAELFRSLVHENLIVLLDDAGSLPDGPIAFSRFDRVDDQRRAGHSSAYYAITKAPVQLIRVSGSTFVNPRAQLHSFGTIDTYIDEAHRRRVQAALADAGVVLAVTSPEAG